MTKEDSVLINQIADRERQCREQYCISHTAFLDVRQCALAESEFRFSKHLLYGGYEDAERRVMIFLPDYADELSPEDDPLEVLRVTAPKGSRELGHRDYLGSVLALGIDRSVTGDIIVWPGGADIIILKSMEDFLLSNYSKAGRVNLSASIVPLAELKAPQGSGITRTDSVASLRLDSLVSSAFKLSRGRAQEAVRSGLVFVNGLQCLKADKELAEGDKIVLRGMGRAVLTEVGGKTRKDRIFITFTL